MTSKRAGGQMTSERVPESVTFGVADQDGHGHARPARWLAHNTAQLAWRVACRVARAAEPEVYARDGVISTHRHAFMDDPLFQRAYHRGVRAIGGEDRYRWQWRVHIGLWTATNASRLEGDFVECGVNQGFLSSAVMEALDWDTQGKTFYLLDTFAGLDPRFITAVERGAGALEDSEKHLRDGFYVDSVDSVRANFAQWRNQRIIVGSIPDTLDQVDATSVAYLHIDMNCAPPEVAAIRHFWPLLSPGAFVLLDDYAYVGFEEQRLAMDAFAREVGVPICAMPTGQGLLTKPRT
jgi:hypothetical protein